MLEKEYYSSQYIWTPIAYSGYNSNAYSIISTV